VASIVILKVSSLYNAGHNKCKELFPTKLQFKVDKNPPWPKINDVVSTVEQTLSTVEQTLSTVEQGLLARLLKNDMQ
jgi:hypothetical protein